MSVNIEGPVRGQSFSPNMREVTLKYVQPDKRCKPNPVYQAMFADLMQLPSLRETGIMVPAMIDQLDAVVCRLDSMGMPATWGNVVDETEYLRDSHFSGCEVHRCPECHHWTGLMAVVYEVKQDLCQEKGNLDRNKDFFNLDN